MREATRSRHSPAGLALVLLLHAFILYFLLIERSIIYQIAAVRYSQLVFIVMPRPKPAVKTAMVPRIPTVNTTSGKPRVKATNIPDGSPPPAMEALSPPMETPSIVDSQDLFKQAARMNIDSLIKQAGKADRDTRSTGEMQEIGPAPDSIETVMTRAFTAAKLAVPLKWYEAARIELFSAPNDTRRIY